MDGKREAQVRQFRRLDFACISFREALALTQHVLKLGIHPKSPDAALYSACLAGVATTYARPFLQADGLGPLPSKYAQGFRDANMAKTHQDLLNARHCVFAHRDLEKAEELHLHPDSHPVTYESRIVIGVSPEGKATIHSEPALLYITEGDLPDIVELCEFQLTRAGKEAIALLVNMAGTKPYRPGVYVVGKDFP